MGKILSGHTHDARVLKEQKEKREFEREYGIEGHWWARFIDPNQSEEEIKKQIDKYSDPNYLVSGSCEMKPYRSRKK